MDPEHHDPHSEPSLSFSPTMPRRLDAAANLAFMTPLAEHAPAADGKSGALLTVIGLMFSLLASQSDRLQAMFATPSGERVIAVAMLVGFAAAGLGTAVEAFRTVSPRFPPAPPSLAFFIDIARLDREEYVRRVEALTADEALEQILRYNHTLSRICVLKFARLRMAIRLFQAAFLCWFVLMLLISVRVVF